MNNYINFQHKLGLFLLLAFSIFQHTNAQKLDWVQQIASEKNTGADHMVSDGKGHLYILGPFTDTVVFQSRTQSNDTLTQNNPTNLFLAKFDTTGKLIWRKNVTGKSKLNSHAALNIDVQGNLLVATGFTGAIEFPTLSGLATFSTVVHPGYANPVETAICKIDLSGAILWATKIGEGSRGLIPFNVTGDQQGNIVLTGVFTDSADLDPGAGRFIIHGDPASIDIFICKLDASGNFLWGGATGGSWADRPLAVKIDERNNIFITGFFGGTANFDIRGGSQPLFSFGLEDIFLWKLKSDGTLDWVKQFGGPSWDDWGTALEIDTDGFIYLAGCFDLIIDLGGTSGGPLYAAGDRDIFLAKLDSLGNCIWARAMGGKKLDVPSCIALDPDRNIYLAGCFSDTAYFGISPDSLLFSNGNQDIFIAKYDNEGDLLWARSTGGSYSGYMDDYANGIFVDEQRNIFLAGGFKGVNVDFDPGVNVNMLTSPPATTNGYLLKMLCSDDRVIRFQDTACNSYSINNLTFYESGTYDVPFYNSFGCDSVLAILDLAIIPMPPVVIETEQNKAKTTELFASYQWLKNSEPIRGATDRIYTITDNGVYQVAVMSKEGCRDTSEPYSVNNLTVTNIKTNNTVSIYPNPAAEKLYIQGSDGTQLRVIDVNGRTIMSCALPQQGIEIGHLSPDVYLLQIVDSYGQILSVHPITIGTKW